MTNLPEKNEIKSAIKDYLRAKEGTQSDLALLVDVSDTTISNIINEKWANIDIGIWQNVWNVVRPLTVEKLFNTADYASTFNLCEQAQKSHYMSGLIADYGMGKTTALKAFARRKNVFYIYYDVNMKPKNFFYELGRLLGYEYDANVYDQVKKASDTLNSIINPLIIIDESSKLTDKMLMTLHVLRDKTINNCGIVLAGMPYFKSNLIKFANKQKTGISEFLSRVMIWHELTGLRPGEIEIICDSYGIIDKKEVARLKSFKKFRDLSNEILLHSTLNN